MNLSTLFKSLALAATLATGAVMAQDIRLGNPGYGGNGCPAGSASVTLSPDQKSLSILFDQYIVEANDFAKIGRKSCNVAIPVHVPQGYSISIVSVDYRGYVSLPTGAQARLTAEYFFAGRQGPAFSRQWLGRTDTDYTFNNRIGLEALVWSPCGTDVTLRVNSGMMVRTTRGDALATVDSADFNAGIIYQLQWKRCGSNAPVDGFGSF